MKKKEKHCDTCTCGLTKVDWSDREGLVDLTDPEDVARIVICCSLDHSYDRTSDGIPWGIPNEIRQCLAPIVNYHLSAVKPDWQNTTVYMEDKQKEDFKNALINALKEQFTK